MSFDQAISSVGCTMWQGDMTEAMLISFQGEPWTSVFVGHDINPLTQQEETQRLMLERFQEEVRDPQDYDEWT